MSADQLIELVLGKTEEVGKQVIGEKERIKKVENVELVEANKTINLLKRELEMVKNNPEFTKLKN